MTSPVSIPTISQFQHRTEGERSISTWKTQHVEDENGRRYVKITEGSDGNQDILNRIVEIIRYEFSGGKTIFRI